MRKDIDSSFSRHSRGCKTSVISCKLTKRVIVNKSLGYTASSVGLQVLQHLCASVTFLVHKRVCKARFGIKILRRLGLEGLVSRSQSWSLDLGGKVLVLFLTSALSMLYIRVHGMCSVEGASVSAVNEAVVSTEPVDGSS